MDDGPDDRVDWDALSKLSTLAVYMGARRLEPLKARLLTAGVDPNKPVALVRWATRADQRTLVTTVDEMPQAAQRHGMVAPLTALIGDVVELRHTIRWYENRPLYGRRVLVTRSENQARGFSHRLKELGADVLRYPSIKFELMTTGVTQIQEQLDQFDWLLFSSANAVQFFLQALKAASLDIRALGSIRIACVGPVTARSLMDWGLMPDLVPEKYVAEGFLDALKKRLKPGQRCLLPRAERARELIPTTLLEWGVDCTVVPVYRTSQGCVEPEVDDRVRRGEVDILTFTSSSTVHHFIERFSEDELNIFRQTTVAACIGPVTQQTAQEYGLDVQIVPDQYTVTALTDAIVEWCSCRSLISDRDRNEGSED